jgi:hypothetical protein
MLNFNDFSHRNGLFSKSHVLTKSAREDAPSYPKQAAETLFALRQSSLGALIVPNV